MNELNFNIEQRFCLKTQKSVRNLWKATTHRFNFRRIGRFRRAFRKINMPLNPVK